MLKMAGTHKMVLDEIMANFQKKREERRIRDDLAVLEKAGIPKEVRDEITAGLSERRPTTHE